ncbi:MAG: amino acid ABC transporter substrate-binding protein [Thermodesulfobacteriota bacterium]
MFLVNRLALLVLVLLWMTMGSGWANDPVRIGVSISLSGRYAPMGQMYADGLRLWTKEQNAVGGILGRQVDLTVLDDRSDPEAAAKIYGDMLSSGRFDLVFGPYSSLVARRVAPLLEQYRYPTLLPLTTTESAWEPGSRYIFGVNTPESRWTRAIFTVIASCNIERVAVLVDKILHELGSPLDARKWAGRFGLNLFFVETLNKQKPIEQLRRAREAGVQALLVWGYLDDAMVVRKALAEVGWTPKMFVSQVGPALEEYGTELGDLANYTVGCSAWDPAVGRSYPGGLEFLESFYREYQRQPSYQAAIGYAAGVILAEAMVRAREVDREKIRDMLSHLDMITLIGRYGVDERGIQIRQQTVIFQWQNGRKQVVWPEPLMTAPLQFPPETEP